jgi:hypothetical protein
MTKEVNCMTRKGLLVVTVLLAVLMVGATLAQAQGNPPQGPTYVGSDKCATCHQPIHESWAATLHTKMILDPIKDPTVIKADFGKMSNVITDTKLQFKKTDVMLTMGWRYRQRYIIADPKTGRLVMGAGQWNLAGQGPTASDNAWQAAAAGEAALECAVAIPPGFDLARLKFTSADYVGKDSRSRASIAAKPAMAPARNTSRYPPGRPSQSTKRKRSMHKSAGNAIHAVAPQTTRKRHINTLSAIRRAATKAAPTGSRSCRRVS